MAQDPPAQDLMRYEAMAQDALRGVVKTALKRAAAPETGMRASAYRQSGVTQRWRGLLDRRQQAPPQQRTRFAAEGAEVA